MLRERCFSWGNSRVKNLRKGCQACLSNSMELSVTETRNEGKSKGVEVGEVVRRRVCWSFQGLQFILSGVGCYSKSQRVSQSVVSNSLQLCGT